MRTCPAPAMPISTRRSASGGSGCAAGGGAGCGTVGLGAPARLDGMLIDRSAPSISALTSASKLPRCRRAACMPSRGRTDGGRLSSGGTGVSPRKTGTTGILAGQRALDLDPHIVSLGRTVARLELGDPAAADEDEHQIAVRHLAVEPSGPRASKGIFSHDVHEDVELRQTGRQALIEAVGPRLGIRATIVEEIFPATTHPQQSDLVSIHSAIAHGSWTGTDGSRLGEVARTAVVSEGVALAADAWSILPAHRGTKFQADPPSQVAAGQASAEVGQMTTYWPSGG